VGLPFMKKKQHGGDMEGGRAGHNDDLGKPATAKGRTRESPPFNGVCAGPARCTGLPVCVSTRTHPYIAAAPELD